MNNQLWKRRLAFLLALVMMFSQLYVPKVYATGQDMPKEEGSTETEAQTEVPQTLDIPKEYISLNGEESQNIVDLSKVKESEAAPQWAASNGDIPKEYKTIPVVDETDTKEDAVSGMDAATAEMQTNTVEDETEETSPEIIPYIDGEIQAVPEADTMISERAGSGESVSENSIQANEYVQGEILIGNEAREYYFTPEESGSYAIAAWSDDWLKVGLWEYNIETGGCDKNVYWDVKAYNIASAVNLEAGKIYRIYINTFNQSVFHFGILKPVTANKEGGTSVITSAKLSLGEEGNAELVKLAVNSSGGHTYHVVVGNEEIPVTDEGNYEFTIMGSQDVLIWKENQDADSVSLSLEESAVEEVQVPEESGLITQKFSGNFVQSGSLKFYEGYIKFTPATSGKYLFGLLGTYVENDSNYEVSGELAEAYVLTDEGFSNIFSNNRYIEAEANQTYLLKLREVGSHNVNNDVAIDAQMLISKLQDEEIALGEEKEIQPQNGQYIYINLADKEFGAYNIQVQGNQGDYEIVSNGSYYSIGTIEGAYGGRTTNVFYGLQDSYMIIKPVKAEALGTITVLVQRATTDISPDSSDCWKQSVTINNHEERWFAVTPKQDGNYVFCTEEKYSNQYSNINLYRKQDNNLCNLTFDGSYDNNHLAYQLEAGTTYYYRYYQYYDLYGEDKVREDTFTVAFYPESTVDLKEKHESKDAIRKSVAYQVTIPKAGFYNLGVSGKDESYILKIQNADESNVQAKSFVYNQIPRSFLFNKAGTYTIWVIKEIMSEEADSITFTYEEGAVSAKLTIGNSKQVDMESTDGVWLEFTPNQTGWYLLTVPEMDNYIRFNGEISVLSEDGSEIVWESSLPYDSMHDDNSNDGSYNYKWYQRFYVKLVEGRTYYYRLYTWNECTGQITATMSNVAPEISMGTGDAEKEAKAADSIFVLKTNFEEDQLLDFSEFIDVQDVTDNMNSSMEYVSSDDSLYVPKGQREYVVICNHIGEANITLKPHRAENIQTTVSVEFTKNKPFTWLKFTPEKDGFYVLYENQSENTFNTLYYVSDGKLSLVWKTYRFSDGNINGTTMYLKQGNTYYYRVSCDEEATIEYTLFDANGSNNALSLGTNEFSNDKVWFGTNGLTESGYYKIKKGSGTEKIYISFLSVKNKGISTEKDVSITKDEMCVYINVDHSNGVENYVQIFADSEDEKTSISLEKVSMDVKTINYGDSIEEKASEIYKEYHFTPKETGKYSIVMTSNAVSANHKYKTRMVLAGQNNKNISAYSKTWENPTSWKNRYSCSYYLSQGQEYIFYVLSKKPYTINLTKTTDKYVYDYDEYTAFIASGGTIQLTNSLTDDMWDDYDNDYARINGLNGKYVYFNAKNFKDQSKIWFPNEDYVVYENIRDNEITYQNISDNLNNRNKKIYQVTDLYQVNAADVTKSSKANMSEKLSGSDEIVLAKYVPAIVLIQSIKLDGLTALKVGQKTKVTASSSTGNQYAATNPNVVFSSSNPAVLVVDSSGNVEAKSKGTAKVICTSADKNAKAELNVTVTEDVVYAAKVTVSGDKEVNVGDSIQLAAAIDTNGKGKPTVDGVSWSSSDTSIATVDANGKVTGLKEGTVTITAASKDGHAKGTITVQVKNVLAKSISIKGGKILMKKGTTYKWLEYTIKPENTTDKTVVLSSSNKKVVAVTASGNLKAKAVGTAVITAKTTNGKKDTVKVTVTASDIKVKKLSMDKKAEVMVGSKITLKPVFTPINATNKKLDYTSSNEDIATVNSKGVVTAKKTGKVTITAKAKDGSKKTAKCKITVTGPGKTTLNKVDNSQKGTAVLTWKEVKNADGYEIYMSTNKKDYKKIQTIKKATTTEFTKTKLKSKTTYYFKVKAYVNIGKGKKAYGTESKAVKVKIK